jgi:hypothetical protein
MAEPALKLSFKLSGKDYKGFFKQADRSSRSGLYVVLATLLFAATLALYFYVSKFLAAPKLDNPTAIIMTGGVIALLLCAYLFLTRGLRRFFQARKVSRLDSAMQPMSFEIGAEGLTAEDGLSKAWYSWKAISRVDITKDSVVLSLDPLRSVIIPRRVLGDEERVKDFKRHIDAFISAAQRG